MSVVAAKRACWHLLYRVPLRKLQAQVRLPPPPPKVGLENLEARCDFPCPKFESPTRLDYIP